MKIAKILLVSVFALAICKPAGAINFDVKNVKAFGSVDMFTVGTIENRADNQMKKERTADDTDLTNPGAASGRFGPGFVSYGLATDAALGFRLGALYPVENVADFGLSWGYVGGPNTETKIDGAKYSNTDRRFYRFLLEGRKDFKYNDKISFLGGAGLGWAFGKQDLNIVYSRANVQNGVRITNYDQYFNGLTWELSAGVNYKATDKMDVNLGVRYAGFPSAPHRIDTVSGTQEIVGFNYNAFGFFAGVQF